MTQLTISAVRATANTEFVRNAMELESVVFYERFGNTVDQLASEYSYFWDDTVFLVTGDRHIEGMMRLQLPGGSDRKSLRDAALPPFSVDVKAALAASSAEASEVIDLVTLAVASSSRGHGLGPALMAGAFEYASQLGIEYGCAMIDTHVHAYLGRCGIHLPAMLGASSASYLGSSQSLPLLLPIEPALTSARQWLSSRHVRVKLDADV
jgi:GNAT superfamily N-acetyltransferase